MNYVEPIRDRKKIAQIKNLLRGQKRFRIYCSSSSDKLRPADLRSVAASYWPFPGREGQGTTALLDKGTKTGQTTGGRDQRQHPGGHGGYLAAYPEVAKDPDNFIFFSSKGEDYSTRSKRGQAWKLVSAICREVGLSGEFGTHSLRKTWGYHARLNGVDLALIMHKLNHESIAYTRRYLESPMTNSRP